MKKIVVVLFISIISLSHLFSNPIEKRTAETVALNYIHYRNPSVTYTIKEIVAEKEGNMILYYTVYFNEGGWVMVSGDNNVIPILGHSLKGTRKDNVPKPPGLVALLESYKDQIRITKGSKSLQHHTVKKQWDTFLYPVQVKSGYTPHTRLLNTSRGYVRWGQSINNSGTCTPAYNAYAPSAGLDLLGECRCDNRPAGCGAVAMAQIMWYWQFPHRLYRSGPVNLLYPSYDWEIMGTAIIDDPEELKAADAIARLIYDCGQRASMNFSCLGSWATTYNVRDALKSFGYTGAAKRKRSHYSNSGWQNRMIKEIDAGRPVLYRGGCVVSDWFSVHYFILDGYKLNPTEFHINWGWRGSEDGYYALGDLNPYGRDYTGCNYAIVGIEPDCSYFPRNIDASIYNSLINPNHFWHDRARESITLPPSGETLTVNSGGKYRLTAGKSITLKPGFMASSGSDFMATIEGCSYTKSKDVAIYRDEEDGFFERSLTTTTEYGSDDIAADIGLAVYPNPSSGTVTVETSLSDNQYTLEVINPMGEIIHSDNYTEPKIELYLYNQPKGLYLIRVTHNKMLYQTKLILQ